MTFILPSASLFKGGVNNFITTIHYPLAIHEIFSLLPVTSSSTSHPMNSFHDSPTMTRACPLKFCCKSPEVQYVTSFPPNSVIRHDSGSVILDSSGVLVGARCSKIMPNQIGLELLSIYNQMESPCSFLVKGKQVANVCANFVVSGLKEDHNTKLKMSHAPKSERTALMEMEMRCKLQALFMCNIYLTIKCEFGWLFEPENHWLRNSKVELYAHWVSGVTAGKIFWPRSHVDPDV